MRFSIVVMALSVLVGLEIACSHNTDKIGRSQNVAPVALLQPVAEEQHSGLPMPFPSLVPTKEAPPLVDNVYTPNSSLVFAMGDLLTIDKDTRPFIRYLSLYNVPKLDRPRLAETVSFVIHSLSRRRKPYIPVFVGASDQTVIRVNLLDYDIPPKAWDDLGRKGSGPTPFPDPYFHAFIERLEDCFEEKPIKKKVPTGNGDFKIVDAIEKIPIPGKKEKKQIQISTPPWLDQKTMIALINEMYFEPTYISESPILRADWFIVNSTLAPAYYDFLELGKNIKDFQNMIFANSEIVKKAGSQDKAVVLRSVVAKHNRTLNREPILGSSYGYYWYSHDSLRSVGNRDYMKNLLDEEFDATEDIGSLPNGLQAYFLTDGKGNRLNDADINIARDKGSPDDPVVRTAKSCMVCHSEGIRPIKDEMRTLTQFFKNKEQVKLIMPADYKLYKRIEDLFSSNLEKQIADDQQHYANAVAAVNGLAPEVNAAQLARFYDTYTETLLTKDVIAREVGISVEELEKYIRGIEVAPNTRMGSNDNIINGLIQNPIRPVIRDQWQQSFQGFMLLLMQMKGHETGEKPKIEVTMPEKKVEKPK